MGRAVARMSRCAENTGSAHPGRDASHTDCVDQYVQPLHQPAPAAPGGSTVVSLRLDHAPGKGRFYIADSLVPKGSTVLSVAPLCHALRAECASTHCAVCWRDTCGSNRTCCPACGCWVTCASCSKHHARAMEQHLGSGDCSTMRAVRCASAESRIGSDSIRLQRVGLFVGRAH